jgi:hypothetical protein
MMVREAPLHAGHLRNMLAATEMGAIIHPPVPAFYTEPKTISDMVDHTLGRVLDCFGLEMANMPRWGEPGMPKDVEAGPLASFLNQACALMVAMPAICTGSSASRLASWERTSRLTLRVFSAPSDAETNRRGDRKLSMKIAFVAVAGRVGSRLATEFLSGSRALTGVALHVHAVSAKSGSRENRRSQYLR